MTKTVNAKENIKNSSVEQLLQLLEELTNEQMNLKLQKAMGQLSAPHMLRNARKNIARVKTQLHTLVSEV